MARKMCDVCSVRPATIAIRRIVPGGGQRVEHLCDVHAAQVRGRRSSFGGGGLFDDFFDDFFDQFFETPAGGPRRVPIGEEDTRRRAEHVDVTRFFSDSTSELLRRAAQRAMEWGHADLTTEHLLDAALQDDMARHVLDWVDADPDTISAQLEEEAEKGGRTEDSPCLAPDAKRAILAAYEESQTLGSSYIGPEHVLLTLARDEESEAGRLLARFGISHTKLRGAVVRGVSKEGEAREAASSTPTVDEFSRDLTRMAKEGKLDPVIGREDEIEMTIEAVELLAEEGSDPESGARPLRRTIQRRVDNQLSRMVLDGSLESGDRVIVAAEDGELTFEVVEGAAVTGGAG